MRTGKTKAEHQMTELYLVREIIKQHKEIRALKQPRSRWVRLKQFILGK